MELTSLLTLACAILSASAAQVSLTVSLPAKPNPFLLPPSTHATLSSLHKRLDAPLSAVNTFGFRNVSADSYLLDVHCATDTFQPLRVDVGEDGAVKVWETFRGNEWGNKGEEVPVKSEGESWRGFSVKALGGKIFFIERPACELSLYPSYSGRPLDYASSVKLTCVCNSFRAEHPQEPHDPTGSRHNGHRIWHAVPNG